MINLKEDLTIKIETLSNNIINKVTAADSSKYLDQSGVENKLLSEISNDILEFCQRYVDGYQSSDHYQSPTPQSNYLTQAEEEARWLRAENARLKS